MCLAFLTDGESWSTRPWRLRLRQPAHGAAGARLACGGRQSAVLWSGARSSLDNPARAGIHDDFVTPRSTAGRLGWSMKRSMPKSSVSMAPFLGPTESMVSAMTAARLVCFGDKLNAFDPSSGRCSVRSMSPRMQERPSTANTCSDRRESHSEDRSENWPSARHHPAPAVAETQGLRGLKEHSGSGSIEPKNLSG